VYEAALVSILAVGEQSTGHAGVVVGAGVTVFAVGPETASIGETTEATSTTSVILFIVCTKRRKKHHFFDSIKIPLQSDGEN
jgi:hypothetical protein